ncbi:ABC transporter transmembrane region [Gemmatirosa kalamazoonensis]|uniref:ABC transporter transmembrane region n=2 Tax=Gemmatirosa kalamazoonensis TaxID=861299 RepID=W0RIE9_9BACT|nr:ABC transporter transmembrane region [Gemmatirosa kalamazoonensis]
MYGRLLPFLRPHVSRLVGAIGSSLLAAVFDAFTLALLIPFLGALFQEPRYGVTGTDLVSRVLRATVSTLLVPGDQMASLQRVVLVIIAAVLVKNVFVWLAGHLGAQLQEYVTRDLRDAVYAHLARLPLGYFLSTKTGQILARVLTDTAQAKQLVVEVVTRSLQSAAQVLVTVALMIAISWRLSLIIPVAAVALVGALNPLLRKLRKRHRSQSAQYGEITSVAQETVNGVRLVKSFGGERYEIERFRSASHDFAKGGVRAARLATMAQPVTEVVSTGIAVAVLWYGARLVIVDHTLGASALILFLVYVMNMLRPLKQLSQVPTTAQQALAAAERLFDVLDRPTEQALDRGTIAPARFERSLTFDRVTFAYGGDPVLRDVSLTARRGQVVALVGPSGAGKSTLVDLIPRFHEPTAGRVLLDGVDTREFRLDALRALIGIVSQDTVLFNDTVRNNIAYGAGDRFTDAQVEAAARAANAHGFVAELPHGYDTVLGERGARLSGGQRQRIAIARALLVDPPILVLDEATSALDTESERLVQEAIDRLLANRTVFVIAHRLSTVVHADQILVLDRGAIVERGTHAELLAIGGMYARLHALQFRAAGEEAA